MSVCPFTTETMLIEAQCLGEVCLWHLGGERLLYQSGVGGLVTRSGHWPWPLKVEVSTFAYVRNSATLRSCGIRPIPAWPNASGKLRSPPASRAFYCTLWDREAPKSRRPPLSNKVLGLAVPQTLRASADEVIE